jgi:hypothetical protein
MANREIPRWLEKVEIAIGIPIVHWSIAIAALGFLLWLLCGCAGIENNDAYWNKTIRDPLHWDSSVWLESRIESVSHSNIDGIVLDQYQTKPKKPTLRK